MDNKNAAHAPAGIKKWRNYSALSKVKAGLETLAAEIAAALEVLIDHQDEVADTGEKIVACKTGLAQAAGILKAMEYRELALLVDEMSGLLEDATGPKHALTAKSVEALQLLYVAVGDFPGILEGVLSGRIRDWHEYSHLFNRIRKARDLSVVFSSQALLNNHNIDFARLVRNNPGHISSLCDRQIANFEKARQAMLAQSDHAVSVTAIRKVFRNLEMLYRDFRLGTLWGLCSSLADSIGDEPQASDAGAFALLFSFSSIMQRVSKEGTLLLDQNIPENILEQVLDGLRQTGLASERLYAARYWYNLDLRLCREYRKRYSDLMVSHARKGAYIKAIKLLVADIRLITEEINQVINETSTDSTEPGKYIEALKSIHGTVGALDIGPAVEVLENGIARLEINSVLADAEPPNAAFEVMQHTAHALCQCEAILQAKSEELERSVFTPVKGSEQPRPLTGAKLNVVVQSIKNLEQVVIGVNNYVDAGLDRRKLEESLGLLDEAAAGLTAVPLDGAASWVAGCRGFAANLLAHQRAPHDDDSFQQFAHLLLNIILYLEQVTIGREADLGQHIQATDAMLARITAALTPVSFAPPMDHVAAEESSQPEPASPGAATVAVDEEIKGFFLEETAEITAQIAASLATLGEQPDDAAALADLRRAFHTLKGSGRMVQAFALGELAWAVENVLNISASRGKGLEPALLALVHDIMQALPALIEDFKADAPCAFEAESTADLVARVNGLLRPIAAPTLAVESPAPQPGAIAHSEHEASPDPAPADDEAAIGLLHAAEREADMAAIFVMEAERQIHSVRQLLEAPNGLTVQGQLITSTDFLIPVHTLLGGSGGAHLDDFRRLTVQLERFLHEHPYRTLDQGLKEMLAGFCGYVGRAIATLRGGAGTGEDEMAEESRRLGESLARLEQAFSQPWNKPAAAEPTDAAPRSATETGSALTVAGMPAEVQPTRAVDQDLLLQGFLLEAKATGALIRVSYKDFRNAPVASGQPAILQKQLSLLEGAAHVGNQKAISDMCHTLTVAWKQFNEQLFRIDDAVLAALDECHAWIDDALGRLGQGQAVPASTALAAGLTELLQRRMASLALDRDNEAREKAEDGLLAVFVEEAGEILGELDSNISDWRQSPGDQLIIDNLLRSLHTLKGSAALVGEKELSECAHGFETFIIKVRTAPSAMDKTWFTEAENRLSQLQEICSHYHRDEAGSVRRDSTAIEAIFANGHEVVRAAPGPALAQAQPTARASGPAAEQASGPAAEQASGPAAEQARLRVVQNQQPTALDEQVRVSSNLLKSLLNDVNEISIAQTRVEQNLGEFKALLSDMDETLGRLSGSIHNFGKQAKSRQLLSVQPQGESDPQGDFDALEMDRYTELQQITLSLLEDYDDLLDIRKNLADRLKGVDSFLLEQQRSANKLQDGLISSQMVPFAGIIPRLRRLTRQIGAELGKDVIIKFNNPEGKMDRNVLQTIINPIEHMIRNAIDHGVESPEERARSGKPEQAEITVALSRQRGNIILDVSDDGRGINVNGIKRKAVEKGLLEPDARITDRDAYRFIFTAGFSTSETLSSISGRGVGLDVVNSEIHQIGGDIEILSRPWVGTTFRIRLPLTSSLNRTLLFTLDGAEYVALLSTIDGVMLEKIGKLREFYQHEQTARLEYGKKQYELVYMGSLLEQGARPVFGESDNHSAPILLISGKDRNIALQVDSIIGSKNLVVKALGPQFSAIPGLSGGVIMGDGHVVIVLDPVSLADNHAVENGVLVQVMPPATPAVGKEDKVITVLVVDDSITVRKVTSAILKRNGMNVILAKNGMEAVEILQNQTPDVMLLDIEMPQMDGFEVATYIRRQVNGIEDLPIIMITSRIGDKHRSRAEEIGVNQYMCKPFQEDNLLAAIAGYH